VARHAFGPGLEVLTTFAILASLLLVLCGFMVLLKGIWAPIVLTVVSHYFADIMEMDHADDAVLLVCIIVTLPLFLSQDLHGLRYVRMYLLIRSFTVSNMLIFFWAHKSLLPPLSPLRYSHSSYVSFASIVVLCLAMLYRAYEKNTQDPALFAHQVLYVTPYVTDGLYACPIIALAFVSSFNVVEVHCALVDPTRQRIREVIHSAVTWSMALMFVFAVVGYLNGYANTNGNILLNFDPTDEVIFLGRIGCGVCTQLAMPMSLLPCRNALLALPVQFIEWLVPTQTPSSAENSELPPLDEESVLKDSEAKPLLYQSTQNVGAEEESSNTTSPVHAVDSDEYVKKEKILRYSTTFAILFMCYAGAVLAPGVAVVWSICG
jgi:amino acid permease